jgi:hypothetical protein
VQVVRKKDYRVVLVDVDSIQIYPNDRSYLDSERCNDNHLKQKSGKGHLCFETENNTL